MIATSETRPATQRQWFGVSQIRFTEQRATGRISISYWLLLVFLILLYANLPLVMPSLEAYARQSWWPELRSSCCWSRRYSRGRVSNLPGPKDSCCSAFWAARRSLP